MVDTWFSAAIIITDVQVSLFYNDVCVSLVFLANCCDVLNLLTAAQDAQAINVNTAELS